jgi:hypothetical protein
MPSSAGPTRLDIRMYQVGFGDCFLLSFRYPSSDRHVLIDFGTTGTPDGKNKARLIGIANDIKSRCAGKLTAVVATHRHRDHIAGFDPTAKGPGAIIAACKPEVVIQPWTEDPKAARTAAAPSKSFRQLYFKTWQLMERANILAIDELNSLPRLPFALLPLAERLRFVGEDNLENKAAVKNLMTMGIRKPVYTYGGQPSGLEKLLPGVKVRVLGPPPLAIRSQRKTDPEFWLQRQRFWNIEAGRVRPASGGTRRRRGTPGPSLPPECRWFVRRAQRARLQELLQLVRIVDNALNSTSLILLFDVCGQRLLFPGDAQIENWEYALRNKANVSLLRDVSLYKVGHHGSLNATPKSLWSIMTNGKKRRRTSLLSTMPNKHGGKNGSPTEVPRRTLVRALKAKSTLYTTESLGSSKLVLFHDVVIK